VVCSEVKPGRAAVVTTRKTAAGVRARAHCQCLAFLMRSYGHLDSSLQPYGNSATLRIAPGGIEPRFGGEQRHFDGRSGH
jgi:hypothetical protein